MEVVSLRSGASGRLAAAEDVIELKKLEKAVLGAEKRRHGVGWTELEGMGPRGESLRMNGNRTGSGSASSGLPSVGEDEEDLELGERRCGGGDNNQRREDGGADARIR